MTDSLLHRALLLVIEPRAVEIGSNLCASQYQQELSTVSRMAVASSSKHVAGVRKVWAGTS